MAPMIAPIPIGTSLPNMSAPRFSANRLTTYLSIREFNDDIAGSGSEAMVSDTQPPLVRPGPSRSATAVVLSPTSTAKTRARRRSRWSRGMACTEASASTNSAVASRNTTTSPAAANHAARVPIPGKVAAAPTAAPLAVTTDKKRFSSLATILAGLAPGWARRRRATYACAAGPCIRELRSMTCANARVDTLGRPPVPASCGSGSAAFADRLSNLFQDLIRRALIFSPANGVPSG